MTMNQTSMTGPKMPPMKEVPLRWMTNNRHEDRHRQRDTTARVNCGA